jgi:8-oxo-dGTP diphosphatase / 2-hydroxy-dATP diphosphatase
MKKLLTLCMVCEEDSVLLGMKKRGFGEGRWNGFGGKLEAGETIEQAALREVQEEIGIVPTTMEKVGILEFAFESDPKVLEVHVFKVLSYEGEPAESEEMRPQWFAYNEVPFTQMWADDEYWFPYLRAGRLFKGRFLFDKPATTEYPGLILEQTLGEVERL